MLEKLGHSVHFGIEESLLPETDIIITMGGDGLIMNVANRVVDYEIPLLRINFGFVGFLASIEPEEALAKIIEVTEKKNYIITRKNRLEVLIGAQSEKDIAHNFHTKGNALNDIVIDRDDISIITVVVRVKDKRKKFVFRCDALIFFTRTGSTAYNMSAGGASLFKERLIGAKAVSPTAAASPHQLQLDDDAVFEAELVRGKAVIVADGAKLVNMEGNKILIRKSPKYSYFLEVGDIPKLEV
jgi:NAD+ kinase